MRKAGIPNPASAAETRAILDELGLTQPDLAALGGLGERQGQRRAETGMNSYDAVLLRLLRNHPELLGEAWEHAGLPGGRRVNPRGRPKRAQAGRRPVAQN